jgi:hypothetical protein
VSLQATQVLLTESKKYEGGHLEQTSGPLQERHLSPKTFVQLMQFARSLYSPTLHYLIPNPSIKANETPTTRIDPIIRETSISLT